MGLASFFSLCFGFFSGQYVDICVTRECINTANILTRNMPSTDPAYKYMACENFYEYACGNYPNAFPLRPGRKSEMMTNYAVEQIDEVLAGLLWRANSNNDPESLGTVRREYRQCLTENRSQQGVRICVSKIKKIFPRAAVYLLVNALGGYEARNQMSQILENVINSFIRKINSSSLDVYEQEQAIRKIRTVNRFVLFFDEIMNNPDILDRGEEWNTSALLAYTCGYNSLLHTIIIPLTVMGIPYFNYGIESMNYGGLGYAVGHETGHFFDLEAINANLRYAPTEDTKYHVISWEDNDELVESFRQQYKQFAFQEETINGESVLPQED